MDDTDSPAGSPRLESSQLNTDVSLSGLGEVKVNLDLGGLQGLLQNLTTALDAKFEAMCARDPNHRAF